MRGSKEIEAWINTISTSIIINIVIWYLAFDMWQSNISFWEVIIFVTFINAIMPLVIGGLFAWDRTFEGENDYYVRYYPILAWIISAIVMVIVFVIKLLSN